jgi:hypothetical protein
MNGGMDVSRRTIVRLLIFAAWLLALWAPFPFLARLALAVKRPPSACESRGMTNEDVRSLERHHGTMALKMTENRIFIRRDGRWLPVLDCGRG